MADQDPWGKPGQNGQSDNKPNDNNVDDKNNQPGWNQRDQKNDQNPPDIEEVFNNLLKKLGGGKKGGSNSNKSGQIPMNFAKLLPIAAVVGAIIWGVSGFYTVKEAERGVVTRFGQLHSIVQPGLNWKPTFIDQVRQVNVEKVETLQASGSMLTKDENMVNVEMAVQYRVQDPAKYLFSVSNPNDSLRQATDSALRYVIGHMMMDEILTTGRTVVRDDTWKALNEIIKPYDMGLEVIAVTFQSARPPEEVKAAFDDAIKAQEDEQRYIREAEAYARGKEPIARGEAQRTIEAATAYKDQVVLDAQGEVDRFQQLLPEFRKAPEVMRERLYLQTMEKVMAQTPKVMMDGSGNNLTVLPLEQILRTQNNRIAEPNNGNELKSEPTKSAVKNSEENRVSTPTPSYSATQSESTQRQGRF